MKPVLMTIAALFMLTLAVTDARAEGEESACTVNSQVILDNLDAQLAKALDAPQMEARTRAIQHVIHFSTSCGHKVAFEKVVPKLVEIYATSDDAAQQALAITALQTVGEGYAMRHLMEMCGQDSTVAEQMRRALSTRYRERRAAAGYGDATL